MAQKNQARKIVKIHKDFELNKSPCIIFCAKMSKHFQYIYYSQKELKHFGVEMSLEYGILAHFESKIYKDFWAISIFYVLNCFKPFLICFETQCLKKIRQEKFWTISSLYVLYSLINVLEQNARKNQTRKTIPSLHV